MHVATSPGVAVAVAVVSTGVGHRCGCNVAGALPQTTGRVATDHLGATGYAGSHGAQTDAVHVAARVAVVYVTFAEELGILVEYLN